MSVEGLTSVSSSSSSSVLPVPKHLVQCLMIQAHHIIEHCSADPAPGAPGIFKDSMSKFRPGGYKDKNKEGKTGVKYFTIGLSETNLFE